MGCFLAPVTEALVLTCVDKALKRKNKDKEEVKVNVFRENLPTLNKMLYGGSALLAFEHVWHGELSPIFPFLTALKDKDDAIVLLKEIATTGVGMAVLVTLVWVGICCLKLSKAAKRTNVKVE